MVSEAGLASYFVGTQAGLAVGDQVGTALARAAFVVCDQVTLTATAAAAVLTARLAGSN